MDISDMPISEISPIIEDAKIARTLEVGVLMEAIGRSFSSEDQ